MAARSWWQSPNIRLLLGLRAAGLAALAACGGPASAPPPEPAPPSDPCVIPTGEPGEPRELVVATLAPEDTAIVARRQPQPLIRLDCTGAARPAAAESWSPDSSHRTWTFVLAPSATSVTAGSVAAEWNSRSEPATVLRQAGVSAVVPLDGRRLVVTTDQRFDSVPAFFAHPSLGVVTDSSPALGTTFAFRRPVSGDLRDALEAGADIVRTGDPKLIEYARSRDDYVVHQLPWSRTYLLLLRSSMTESSSGQRDTAFIRIPGDTSSFRAALARDAVPTDARAAESSYSWDALLTCFLQRRVNPGASPPPTIDAASATIDAVLYTDRDPVARALAERVVALSDGRVSARGASERAMTAAIRGGSARAFVVAVPRAPLVPCAVLSAWPPSMAFLPLVDTRLTAIVRRDVPPLTVDLDGTIRAVEAP